jgi:hypothetical protein
MAVVLRVYIIDPGDSMIKVGHEFFGQTKEEAETYFEEHLPTEDLPRVEDFDMEEEEE